MRPAILLLVCLIAGCVYDRYGLYAAGQCMLAALSSSAVNSTWNHPWHGGWWHWHPGPYHGYWHWHPHRP